MSNVVIRCSVSVFLTFLAGAIVLAVQIYFDNDQTEDGYPKSILLEIGLAIVAVFIALPNLAFVLILYYSKLMREVLSSYKYMIGEIVVLYAVNHALFKFAAQFPRDVKGKYFDVGPMVLYTFGIMFLAAFVFRWIMNRHATTRN